MSNFAYVAAKPSEKDQVVGSGYKEWTIKTTNKAGRYTCVLTAVLFRPDYPESVYCRISPPDADSLYWGLDSSTADTPVYFFFQHHRSALNWIW